MATKKAGAKGAKKSDVIREILTAHPKASLKEVQATLQEKGIKASDALVNKIKYAPNRGKRSSSAKGGDGLSKATAIRNMFGEMGRHARPRDIIAALKARGVVVTSAQVSTLRSKMPRNGAGRVSGGHGVSLDHLLAAKQFAEQIGGLERAREAVESLARLMQN